MSTVLPPEVRLGNDVARAMRHLPHEAATKAVATHLTKFWEPRMRRALVERVRSGDERIDPLLADAVRAHLTGDREFDTAAIAEPSGG